MQGDPLFMVLFNLLLEYIIKRIQIETYKTISIRTHHDLHVQMTRKT